MEDFEYSVQISELDWETFFQVCEECNMLPPSLAGLDDSGMSDIDEKGNPRPRSAMPWRSRDPERIDGPPDCDGSPVEFYLSKYGLNTPEQVLSGSEEDCHMETVHEYFERLKSISSTRDHKHVSKPEGFGPAKTAMPALSQHSNLCTCNETTDDDLEDIKKKYSCPDTELFIKEEDWSLEILKEGLKSRGDFNCDKDGKQSMLQPDIERTSCEVAVKDLPGKVTEKALTGPNHQKNTGSPLTESKSDFTELSVCHEQVSSVTPRRKRRKKKRSSEPSDSDRGREALFPGNQSDSAEDQHAKKVAIKMTNTTESLQVHSPSLSQRSVSKSIRVPQHKRVMDSISGSSHTGKSVPDGQCTMSAKFTFAEPSAFMEMIPQCDNPPPVSSASQVNSNLSLEINAAPKASVVPLTSINTSHVRNAESIIESTKDNLEVQPPALVTSDPSIYSKIPHSHQIQREHTPPPDVQPVESGAVGHRKTSASENVSCVTFPDFRNTPAFAVFYQDAEPEEHLSRTSHCDVRLVEQDPVKLNEISPQHSQMTPLETQMYETSHTTEMNAEIKSRVLSKTNTVGIEALLCSDNQVDISPSSNSKDTSEIREDETKHFKTAHIEIESQLGRTKEVNKDVTDLVSIAKIKKREKVEILLPVSPDTETPDEDEANSVETVDTRIKSQLKRAKTIPPSDTEHMNREEKEEVIIPATESTNAKDVKMSSGTKFHNDVLSPSANDVHILSSGADNIPRKHVPMTTGANDVDNKDVQMLSSSAKEKTKGAANLPHGGTENKYVTGNPPEYLPNRWKRYKPESITHIFTERDIESPGEAQSAETVDTQTKSHIGAKNVNGKDAGNPSSEVKYINTEEREESLFPETENMNATDVEMSPGSEYINTKEEHILSSGADNITCKNVLMVSTGADDTDSKEVQSISSAAQKEAKSEANMPHIDIINTSVAGKPPEHSLNCCSSREIPESIEDLVRENEDESKILYSNSENGTKEISKFPEPVEAPGKRNTVQINDNVQPLEKQLTECHSLIDLTEPEKQSSEYSNSDSNPPIITTSENQKHSLNTQSSGLSEDHELNGVPATPRSESKNEPQNLETLDLDSISQPTTPVFAISSFWNEMEKLTINDILRLRQVGQAQHPSVLLQPENSSIADATDATDSGYFTQFDEYKPDRSSGDMSFISDYDEDLAQLMTSDAGKLDEDLQGCMWECDPNLSGTCTGKEDVFMLDSETAPPSSFHRDNSHQGLRKICKNISIQNLQSLEDQPLTKILRNASWHSLHSTYSSHLEVPDDYVDPFDRVQTSSPVSLSDEEEELDGANVTFSEILEYVFGAEEPKLPVSATETVCSSYILGAESSLPEMYDHFFSEFEAESFFYPHAEDNDSKKDETIPIFSCSRSSTKNLQFPEAYDYFFTDDSPVHSDEEEEPDHTVIRVITRYDHGPTKNQGALTTMDMVEQCFPEKDWSWNFMSRNPFSFRKIRRTGLTVPPDSWALTQVNRSVRTFQRRIQSIHALGTDVSPFPDPLLLSLDNRVFRQLAVQQKLCQEMQNVAADPRVDAPLVSIKHADMCLVCIAFASWVLKSVNPQGVDNWKAVLLANISALSAIRYLRRFTRDEEAKITPLRQIEPA